MKQKCYEGLSNEERDEIEILTNKGYGVREIARVLRRSPNTISYEIKTNSVSGEYTAATLQAVRKGQLTLTPLLKPTPYLEKIMGEAEEDLKHNRNITSTNSKEEAISHLKSLM